jgi:hypothetical protein
MVGAIGAALLALKRLEKIRTSGNEPIAAEQAKVA